MQFHFNKHKSAVQIKKEIKKTLKQLSKKHILRIISSAREEGTSKCLKNNDMEKLFSFIYGFESGRLKADKFKLVLENYNISKDECIFVTDTLGDILEANEIGIKSIGIISKYHNKETLMKGKPFKVISELSELSRIIK
ncbi:HAD hydrolase-like protein [Bacteroidota bacterium]